MHYVAVRGNGDLAGQPMERRTVGGDDRGSDREMVWACSTYSGALWWARARFQQYGGGSIVHIYEAQLDEATVEQDANYDRMPSSVMAASGRFGRLMATFESAEAVDTALATRSGEDSFVDGALDTHC